MRRATPAAGQRPGRTDRAAPVAPSRRFASRALGVLAAVLACTASALAQQQRIEALIENADIGQATVGVHAIDLATGREIVSLHADRTFIPASNMKLLTTGAALAVLGPDFVFRTELIHAGGKLIWRGSGDPSLGDHRMLDQSDPSFGVDDLLDALARAVIDAGVTEVEEIVVDDRVFDRQWVHPGWPDDQLDRHYCAPVAGLNISGNVVAFFPAPARTGVGDPARLLVEPDASWIRRRTEVIARTVPTGGNEVWIRRDPEQNRFTLGGKVQRPSRARLRSAVHDPPLFAGRLLADRLEAAGVRVGPTPEPGSVSEHPAGVRLAGEREELPEGRTLAVVTTPLLDIVNLCNTDSINLYAEALIKRTAHEAFGDAASWRRAAAVVRMVLQQRLGHEHAARTIISDGSGLSRDNAVAPSTLTALLRDLHDDDALRAPFVDSLASPGVGTLRRRFRGVDLRHAVRAKSGSINGVRTLSGYVLDAPSGAGFAFSVLVNDLPLSGPASMNARRLHEQIVAVLDERLASHLRDQRHAEAAEPTTPGR